MISAVLMVSRVSGTHTAQELVFAIDPDAPCPITLLTPKGDEVHILSVDVFRPYESVCAQMGFECTLVVNEDLGESHAYPRYLDLRGYKWLDFFLLIWRRETA